ncbi:hypothetical protein HMI48_05475 [Acidithiobacillus ferrooxidans]|uniref:hypothetical protein n=1 Tax=Acidithiobacillus ferrooxidans TaxID=920 RepID=UPI001C07530A|nr:hypothetical protein [Acidithiobacillus ferrooxidans]MBU2773373.1 hypothetical protein [Acidithiobacillus ferrooxidans]
MARNNDMRIRKLVKRAKNKAHQKKVHTRKTKVEKKKVQVIRWPIPNAEWNDLVRAYGQTFMRPDSQINYLTGVAICALLDGIDAIIINDTGSMVEAMRLQDFFINEFRIQNLAPSEVINNAIFQHSVYAGKIRITENDAINWRVTSKPITIMTAIWEFEDHDECEF